MTANLRAAALGLLMMRVYRRGRSSTESEPAGNHQLIVNMTGDTADEIRAQWRPGYELPVQVIWAARRGH